MADRIISGERSLALEDFRRRVLKAAGGLAALGVGEGDAVAILLRNDFAFLEASLGAAALGAYAAPVNWHYTADEAGHVIEDCGAEVVVVHADLRHQIRPEIAARRELLVVATPPEVARAYGLDEGACVVPPGATEWERWLARAEPWSGAPGPGRPSMIYTSGTTGRPKGVRRAPPAGPGQQQAMRALRAAAFGVRPGMRSVITGPLYHAAPNAYAFAALQAGGEMVLQPRFEAEQLLALIQAHGITHMHLVPTMFIRLLRLPERLRRGHDLSSLEWVVHGAAPCPPALKARMIEWLGPVIHEYYGATESGVITVCDSAQHRARPGTVGRAVAGASVRIYGEDGGALGPGEVGEIYVRHHGVPDFTYHRLDGERRAIERDGLITLGDIGYLDEDGYLYLCDRKTDMVISGGVNIYPAEIEAVLMEMPGLKDCAVFGVPDDEYGEALAAVIEPEPEAQLTAETVRAYLLERQAGYKTPKLIEFGRDLPREDSGKIFKRRLRERHWRGTGRSI